MKIALKIVAILFLLSTSICDARTHRFNLMIYKIGDDTKVDIITCGLHPERKGISVQETVKYIEGLQTASTNLIGVSSGSIFDSDPILLAILNHPSAIISYLHRPYRAFQPPQNALIQRRAEQDADNQLPVRSESKVE